jgi:hypothetical protein
MLEVARLFRGAGAADDATLRLLAVYADNLRRIAKAEADYYEANVERRLRAKGLDERQLIELGTQLGDRVSGLMERVLLMVYRRHHWHVWTEHVINHVEEALEGSDCELACMRRGFRQTSGRLPPDHQCGLSHGHGHRLGLRE